MKKLIILLLMVAVIVSTLYLTHPSWFTSLKISIRKINTQATVTHTWYSSLFFDPYSKPLYAVPQTYQLTPQGLEIGKPKLVFSPKTIHYAHIQEFLLTFSSQKSITKKSVKRAGEWDVVIQAQNELNNSLYFHIIKGNPALYFYSPDSSIVLNTQLTHIKQLSNKTYYLRSHAGEGYLLVAAQGVTYNSQNKSFDFAKSNKSNVLVALPDEFLDKLTVEQSEVGSILSCAQNELEKTDYAFSYNQATKEYEVSDTFSEGLNSQYLYTVWPHMTGAQNQQILGSYATSRGKLLLACGSKLEYKVKVQDLSTNFDQFIDTKKLSDPKALELFGTDYTALMGQTIPQGVYFRGKYIKNLVDLWEVAKLLHKKSEADALYTKFRQLLLEDLSNFTFDQKSGLVFYNHPEFGNETGNDHHYQYGYYVYSYAKLYSTLSDLEKKQVQHLLDQFVSEGIPVVLDGSYPRRARFFDPYESHSWADSQSLFFDGNNQESTSESLFYYYSLWLWSQEVGDNKLTDWSRFIYFSEIQGRNSYWFLINNQSLSQVFARPFASLVFGSKSDYATWFSGEDDKVLGIQLLPINPSSFVSLNFNSYSKQALQKIVTAFDAYFTGSPQKGFYNYYVFFKKINGLPAGEFLEANAPDYYSQSLYYLLK